MKQILFTDQELGVLSGNLRNAIGSTRSYIRENGSDETSKFELDNLKRLQEKVRGAKPTEPSPGLPRLDTIATVIFANLVRMDMTIGQIDQAVHQSIGAATQLIEGLDKTASAPVSPPALPLCPEHLPKPPEDCVYWGERPLNVIAETEADQQDVLCIDATQEDDGWDPGSEGRGYPTIHYALRRGSPIARANGIPD